MSLFHKNTLLGASGAGGAAEALYVDDVFSTFLYTGTATSKSISNGIDLDGEGGMVWCKPRSASNSDEIVDTERGINSALLAVSNEDARTSSEITGFNSDGYTLGYVTGLQNFSGRDFVSWTFRKAPGFFDIVTYVGNGSNRAIAHNLGSKPGFMIIKNLTDDNTYWRTYHHSLGATKSIVLSEEFAVNDFDLIFNDTEPTSTHFTVGTHNDTNGSGDNFVAYLFAHDDQRFGENEDEAIIKCGTYSGTNSDGNFVSLGFEPQWVLTRNASTRTGTFWTVWDSMRGVSAGAFTAPSNGEAYGLHPNNTDAEGDESDLIEFNPTGFTVNGGSTLTNFASGESFVYVAIRRPNKPPTTGTDVLAVAAAAGNSDVTTNFPVDLAFQFRRNSGSKLVLSRMTGANFLVANSNGTESEGANQWYASNTKYLNSGLTSANAAFHLFKRAPGFMDVVAYNGTSSNRTVSHNLAATPQLIIIKDREATQNWRVYSATLGATKYLQLNGDGGEVTDSPGYMWNSTSPTSTQFSLGISNSLNGSSKGYIAYLFATLDGISKVGSYSGTGNDVDVDCGFSAGARFVMIKRTNSTGDWYFYDTARGIASGNDPYIVVPAGGSTDEVTNTDYIDPLNSGFTVTSSAPAALNASGSTYIFLAIA